MKKLLSTTIAVGIFASMSITPVLADVSANALPSLDSAINADVSTTGNDMNIQIQGGQGSVGTLNWNTYNIGSDASVNYEFSAHNQTALNKVNAAGGISQIYGKITSSGCAGCGYDATGKVILVNPNGVLFGDGANVNLNSFTVTNMDAVYDADAKQLKLVAGENQGDFGIVVQDGATIHGSKNVTFAGNNITLYKGSKITTDTVANVGDTAYGKVKLVTADGVNFTYYNNGAINKITDQQVSADKMLISVNGDITSGNIDIRNYSDNAASEINLKNATLKAVKAEKGNDGNIWLTANNKIITEGSTLKTTNLTTAAAERAGGNVQILAGGKVSIGSTNITSVGNVDITSQNYQVVVDGSDIAAAKDVNVTAADIASVQNNSKVAAKNIKVKGGKRAQVVASELNADAIEITGDDVWFDNAYVRANNTIKATATKGNLQADSTSFKAEKIDLAAAKDVKGTIQLNNKKTTINAGNDVDVTLAGVEDRQNGLVATAGNNMTIKTDGTLSVSSLISGKDMTLNAKNVISGYDKTTNYLRNEGDSADRAYIQVGGKFTSTPGFEVTDSEGITADGNYKQRHHIQYGDGSEKILLVNNRPYEAPVPPVPPVQPEEPTVTPDVNDDQASMLHKLPRQPQSMNNNTNISDTRTTFVDVFAAASQIEVVEDEEEE